MINRLQFVHCEECFNTVEEAKAYIVSQMDKIDRPALYGEPMVLKYKNQEDETSPNILLAIGSVGDGETPNVSNRTFFIDFASIENSIEEIKEEIEKSGGDITKLKEIVDEIIKSCGLNEDGTYTAPDDDILSVAKSLNEADEILSKYVQDLEKRNTLYTDDTNSVKLTLNKEDDGQTLSADVKLAEYKTVNHVQIPNIILKEESGLYTNVNLEYDEENNDLIFSVNGEEKSFNLPTETYLVKGEYDIKTESLILTLNTGTEISIDLGELIEEWTVLGENSSTPIILTKDHASYEEQSHVKTWQDVLHADVRIATTEAKPFNILKKTDDGRSLFVDGTAKNIKYLKGGEYITVQEAIDNVKCSISTSNGNIVYRRQDGIYANVDLSYNATTNVLTFKHTSADGQVVSNDLALTSSQLLDDVTYDSAREVIVLRFVTADGKTQKVEIPVSSLITEWDVNNSNTTVTLSKTRDVSGQDKLSANVNISTADNNILENNGHSLYVKGTADNIVFDENYSVEGKINTINQTLGDSINEEVTRAKNSESNLNDKITEVNNSLGEEINRAETSENKIAEDLKDEVTRATSVEKQLENAIEANETSISNEVERATNREDEINALVTTNANSIASEIVRAEKAEEKLNDAVIAEKTARENDITTLTHSLEDEVTRATNAETTLTNNVKTVSDLANSTSTKLANEINRAQTAEVDLNNKLETEVTRAKTAEKSNSDKINANTLDIATLKVDTAKINGDLTDEINRAESAEVEITNNLNAEVTRAKNKENEISTALTNEISRAKEKENTLTTDLVSTNEKLETEKERATTAEATLNTSILSVENSLQEEINRAKGEEISLTNTLNAEIHDRETEITRVEKLVSDNEGKAEEVKEELLQKIADNKQTIADETTRAKAQEAEISGKTVSNKTAIEKEIQDARNAERDITDTVRTVSGDLKTDIDGINVTYDAASNVLTVFTTSGKKEYTLTQASLIDHIEYISATKTLRIYYKVTGESGTKYVDIEVTDLFNQLALNTTKSEAGAVHMELIVDNAAGNDILSAEVKLSSKSTNALVNDGGTLYVSNEATKIVLPDGKNVYEAIENVKTSIATETQNRISSDNDITTSVTEEKTRAEKAEEKLNDAIITEKTARENSYNNLDSSLSNEIARAIAAEETLTLNSTNISNKVTALENSLNAEVSERKLEESKLNSSIEDVATDLENEATLRKNSDTTITNRVDTIELTTAENTRNLNSEIAERKSEDNDLQRAIDTEKLRATTAEGQLTTSVSDINNTLTTVNEKINTLTTSASTINTALTTEKNDRVASEALINNAIRDEKERATASETTLATSIASGDNAVKELLTQEKERATAAEATLTTSIASGDNAIKVLLNEEIARAKESEKEINQTLSGETGKISAKDNNIIVRYDDGIYAKSSQLTYETGTNTLTFTDANGNATPLVLNSIDTIKRIYFDGESDELVFVYTVSGVEQEVRIDAAAFFKGIVGTTDGNVSVTTALTTTQGNSATGITANLDVKDIISTDNSTVKLTKTADNKVSASVNVAKDVPNNILKVDGSDNSLFVNGEASNITATYKDNKTNVQAVIAEIGNDINDLTNEVNYISGSVHDTLIIVDRHTKEITELSAYTKTEFEKVYERIEAIEEKIETEFEKIYKELERLNKKSTIVDDDDNDYIKHTFYVNNDNTSPYYGQTMIHTELSEDLSRDSNSGINNDF